MASTEPAFWKAITAMKGEKTILWYESIVESQAYHGPKLLQNCVTGNLTPRSKARLRRSHGERTKKTILQKYFFWAIVNSLFNITDSCVL